MNVNKEGAHHHRRARHRSPAGRLWHRYRAIALRQCRATARGHGGRRRSGQFLILDDQQRVDLLIVTWAG